MKNKLNEDAVVTTTDNAGAGLDSPKLPIGKQNIFRRYSDLKKKNLKTLNNNNK